MSWSYVTEKLPGELMQAQEKSRNIKKESKSNNAIKVNYPENFNIQ